MYEFTTTYSDGSPYTIDASVAVIDLRRGCFYPVKRLVGGEPGNTTIGGVSVFGPWPKVASYLNRLDQAEA